MVCVFTCTWTHTHIHALSGKPSPSPQGLTVGDFSCSMFLNDEREPLSSFCLVSVFNCRNIIATNAPWLRLFVPAALFLTSSPLCTRSLRAENEVHHTGQLFFRVEKQGLHPDPSLWRSDVSLPSSPELVSWLYTEPILHSPGCLLFLWLCRNKRWAQHRKPTKEV